MYSDAESAGRSEHGAVTDNPARAEHSADTDTAHRTRAAEILPPRGSMPESDGDCLDYVATCLFGLERLVGEEIDALGYERTFTMDGRVGFRAGADAAARCNMWLRTAERLYASLGSFTAPTFDALFEGTKALPWERFIGREDAFPVKGHAVRSQLYSIPDCQSIVKKALADRLGDIYGLRMLPETGVKYQVEFFIFKDEATMMIDLSGTALHKRGYRAEAGDAPLRETLAAALVLQSGWHPWQPLVDPCCGTGTILIEAAFIATSRAPGLTRRFAMEAWPVVNHDYEKIEEIRREARLKFEEGLKRPINISGSDINPEAIELARRHVKQAGLEGRIRLSVRDLRDVTIVDEPGVFIANPPYGERLDNSRAAHAIAKQLGILQSRHPGWTLCAFSADMGFEREYGRRATRRRRYYNGRIECEYHIFEQSTRGESR